MARNIGLLEGVNVGTFSVPDLLGPLNEFEAKNAPEQVFAAGDVQLFRSGPRVSIVGARKAETLAETSLGSVACAGALASGVLKWTTCRPGAHRDAVVRDGA